MSDSYKPILDREFAESFVKDHLKDAVDLLNELLDYGTALVPRAFVSSPRDLKATCLIFVQLQQFLAHLDGVCVLATAGSTLTAGLQMRSMWETSIVMEWILSSDTEAKIQYLYVSNLRKRKQWNNKVIPGTPEALRDPTTATLAPLTAEQLQNLRDQVADIDTTLAKAPYDQISAKFEINYSRRFYDKPWTDVYGNFSIRAIAEAIGKEKEYGIFYSSYSGLSHGSDIWKSITPGNKVTVNGIREMQEIPQMTNLAATLAMRVYEMILKTYRAEEAPNFALKYVKEWQARFRKPYNITLEPKYTMI